MATVSGGLRFLAQRILGLSHEGLRDLYAQFGYPRDIELEAYFAMYLRNDIAARVINSFPKATWREWPILRDEKGNSAVKSSYNADSAEDPAEDAAGGKNYSPFVEAFEDLCERLKVLHFLERADKLAGLGEFSILLMGFGDGQALDQPLGTRAAKLLYLAPYAQRNVTINQWENDEKSDRFGLPLFYTLQKSKSTSGQASQSKTIRVHYSRVLHVAENLLDNEIFGVPRLMPVFNRLMDLEKVVGGSAETFWFNSRPGMGLWADKDAQLDKETIADMKTQAEDFANQLRRILVGSGMTAQSFTATVADPKPNVETLLDLIAGATEIPKRILIGSERGELSSSQDENNWAARIDERRKNFAGPLVLMPFAAAMIATGNLPKPQGEYWIEWPEAASSPREMAEVAVQKTTALRNYLSTPGAELVVPQQEFRTWIGEEPDSEFDIIALDLPEPGGVPIDENNPEIKGQFQRLKTRARGRVA